MQSIDVPRELSDKVLVNGGGHLPPLVIPHTWGSGVALDGVLASSLGDRAVVSLLPPDPAVEDMPRRTESWVARFSAILDALGIHEIGALLGHSYAGVVALELARDRQMAGSPVGYVGLIDSARPRLMPLSHGEATWLFLRDVSTRQDAAARHAHLRWHTQPFLKQRLHAVRTQATAWAQRRGLFNGTSASGNDTVAEDPLKLSVWVSYLDYRGTAVNFPVSLFTTAHSVKRFKDPTLGWSGWLHGGPDVFAIPGPHYTLFDEEHADCLTSILAASLQISSLRSSAARHRHE